MDNTGDITVADTEICRALLKKVQRDRNQNTGKQSELTFPH